jgi:hypothetical protein
MGFCGTDNSDGIISKVIARASDPRPGRALARVDMTRHRVVQAAQAQFRQAAGISEINHPVFLASLSNYLPST